MTTNCYLSYNKMNHVLWLQINMLIDCNIYVDRFTINCIIVLKGKEDFAPSVGGWVHWHYFILLVCLCQCQPCPSGRAKLNLWNNISCLTNLAVTRQVENSTQNINRRILFSLVNSKIILTWKPSIFTKIIFIQYPGKII